MHVSSFQLQDLDSGKVKFFLPDCPQIRKSFRMGQKRWKVPRISRLEKWGPCGPALDNRRGIALPCRAGKEQDKE